MPVPNVRELARKSILGNPVRLGIMIYLLAHERVFFKNLQNVLEISPGKLDSHLRTLKKEDFITIKKIIADRPRTVIIITEKGAVETKKYLRMLENLISKLSE
jgi:DNA-binding MarR family transcriptional regulator